MMSEIIAKALAIVISLCVRFEGMSLRPYLCPAGIPTIGLGSTAYEDGRRVTLADPPISEERAYALASLTLTTIYLPGVRRYCPSSETNPQMQAGLGDFAYNLGLTRLKASTLRRKINAGDLVGARAEILKWVHGGGRVLKGLVIRRHADAALLVRQA